MFGVVLVLEIEAPVVALVPFAVLMMVREHLRRILLAQMSTGSLLQVDLPIAVLQLATAFGLSVSAEQNAAIMAVVGAGLALVAENFTTPAE